MALVILGLGCFRANLPVIIVHDKPSLAKQSQALDEHLEFEVQENPNQGNTWEGFSPEKDIALPAPREALTKACPFPPEAIIRKFTYFLYYISVAAVTNFHKLSD